MEVLMSFLKNRSLAFCLIMSMGPAAFADHHDVQSVTQEDRMTMMAKLAALGLLNVGVNQAGHNVGMSTSKGVIHVTSALYALGVISSNPTFFDLSIRSAVGGVAATISALQPVQSLYAKAPFGIGEGMKEAGPKGVGLATIVLYEGLTTVYQKLFETAKNAFSEKKAEL